MEMHTDAHTTQFIELKGSLLTGQSQFHQPGARSVFHPAKDTAEKDGRHLPQDPACGGYSVSRTPKWTPRDPDGSWSG